MSRSQESLTTEIVTDENTRFVFTIRVEDAETQGNASTDTAICNSRNHIFKNIYSPARVKFFILKLINVYQSYI